jgi:alpha-amylase/alpha-mannosidase (GH57 family)
MSRYVCIHGHFYQPPRENPWLEDVELQDSAYPYHDWNERITAESYRPNSASRILDDNKMIVDIVNNYSRISFNFGPTLLSWMERHTPDVYTAVQQADSEGRQRFSGHGPALAQVYNHMIMPLANIRDKRTQVIWGKRDFEHRFGRAPEGMWLPETAVDIETLEVLAENEIAFTILAPSQAGRTRRRHVGRWKDVNGARIDPKIPCICRLPSGRSITIFFYDGPISKDVAFGGLLNSGEDFAGRLLGGFANDNPDAQLVHIATDGETYGHHHRFGDMALAYCLRHIDSNNLATITVYGEYLEKHPPGHDVEIIENTSWSCVHGIERWRSDCGCNSGRQGWRQQWRGPFRDALNWLRDNLAALYEREISQYIADPWRARDEYIEVILDRSPDRVESFLRRHVGRQLSSEEETKVLRLLEMQRHAMLMFTSCGWFFDEISGIETTQVIQYAARAIQLAFRSSGVELENEFVRRLESAPSNLQEYVNGAGVYKRFVEPAMVDLMRVGAHYAVLSLFEDYPDVSRVYSYTARREVYERRTAGAYHLAIGRTFFRSNITRDEQTLSFAVLHLGDHNLMGGVRQFLDDQRFNEMRSEIGDAFSRSDIAEIIRAIDRHFESHNYSLWHLFRDEQRRVFNRILQSRLHELEASFKSIYEHNYSMMTVLRELAIPLPRAFAVSAEMSINADLRKLLETELPDPDELERSLTETRKWGLDVHRAAFGLLASRKVARLLEAVSGSPHDVELLETVESLVGILQSSSMELDLTLSQLICFTIGRQHYRAVKERAVSGDPDAEKWIESFRRLGRHLGVVTS